MRDHDAPQTKRQRGQGLVEFALVLPIVLVVMVSVAELGLAFSKSQSLGYASREGARVGSALARGYEIDCDDDDWNKKVDAIVVSAVQRILETPDAGINLNNSGLEVRIFRATPDGAENPDLVNIWTYHGPQSGPDVNPDDIVEERIDFDQDVVQWPACSRVNEWDGSDPPDSIGVTIKYDYRFNSPLASVVNALAGGNLKVTLTETTVMALNPTI